MINSEDDVRAWVRSASGGKARWVEPALGSTPGLPDCWVPVEDRQVHLELKAGKLSSSGILKYEVRPEQRREIIAMADDGIAVGLVVGIKGSETVLFLKPTRPVLRGNFQIENGSGSVDRFESKLDNLRSFWCGVNFIFSDFRKTL